jgi:glycosyltransferase involved in cell wall biosynthesis
MIALSVIAPCFDEEGNVAELVRRTLAVFDAMAIAGELVLVDDGSRDGTWRCIEAAVRADDRVRGVRHDENRGIEAGWKSGLEAARGELVCLIDSDLQNQPEDIARLYEVHRREAPDIVQGARRPRGVESRMLFSRALNLLLNLSFGMRLPDNKSGFVLMPRAVLASLLEHRFRYRYFQSFLGAAAGVRRYRIAVVDTDFMPRQAGKSFLSDYPLAVSLRILGELVKYRLETLPLQLGRR